MRDSQLNCENFMSYKGKKHAVYELNRYHNRRQEAITLLGGHCKRCNSVENLEFDHIERSTKSFTISSFWSVSKTLLLAELAKCQLLCQSCHKQKTTTEDITPIKHGDYSFYKHRGCRCSLCKEANMLYMRNYRYVRERPTLV